MTLSDREFSTVCVVGVACSYFVLMAFKTQTVDTGSVGIRSTFGAIGNESFKAGGPYVVWPAVHRFTHVDVKPQVDTVPSIECSTKEGIQITFPKILVYNQLPEEHVIDVITEYGFDYDVLLVRAQVVQRLLEHCNDMSLEDIRSSFSALNDAIKDGLQAHQAHRATGLSITDVIVHKPLFPPSIQANFNRKAEERTALLAEIDTQARRMKESETSRMMLEARHVERMLDAEHAAKVRALEATSIASERGIEARARADAITVTAAANTKLHTERYVELHYQEHVLGKATAYWGTKLPSYVGGLSGPRYPLNTSNVQP